MDYFVLIFISGWWNSIEFISHLILRSITFNCHQKHKEQQKEQLEDVFSALEELLHVLLLWAANSHQHGRFLCT